MPRVPILGGAYKAAGLIAAAQRCVNLYPEKNPADAQPGAPITHYPRPGLTPLFPSVGDVHTSAPPVGRGRGVYTATDGSLFAIVDQVIYHIEYQDFWEWYPIGSLLTPGTGPVCAADNGTTALFVDGSPNGYTVDLTTKTGGVLNQLGDPNFLGGTRADYLDSFICLNQPASPNWYCSLSNQIVFNALYFGTKTAWPDNIQTIIAIEREMWILGVYKSEVWYNSGTVPFPYSAEPGIIVEHGCAAPYSVAKQDISIFWLSQSPEGARMVMTNKGHTAVRISNHAIEEAMLTYPRVDDAIGMTYQIRGHNFYKLHFPTADRTWGYDAATSQWHEDAFFDTNGIQHRSKIAYCTYAYGTNVGQDWSTGQLYKIDETNFTDNGAPMICIRTVPHLLDEGDFDRVTYWKLIADIETGTGTGTVNQPTETRPWSLGFSPGFGPVNYVDPPEMSLRVSLDRGFSFGNPVLKPMGAAGLYKTTPTWYQLGYARDIICELSWSTPQQSALNGVFVEFEKHEGDT